MAAHKARLPDRGVLPKGPFNHDETSTMISHRGSALVRLALSLAGLTLAACDRATDVTLPALHGGAANLSGNAAKSGSIAARVLTSKAGVSVLEVRTGTLDNATNTGTPNGWFEKIKYTVVLQDGSKNGKKIFERNVNFKKSAPTLFGEVINVCKKADQDDPDDDGDDRKPHPPCTLQMDKSYVIAIEANVRGVGGDGKKNDVVRGSALFFNDPDVDMSAEKVQMVITDDPRTSTDILAATVDSATTYQARFVNSSADVGILATCEVHVFNSSNVDVTPSGLTYRWIPNARPPYDATKPGSSASDTTTIKPGEQALCEFRMKLSPTGSYRIVVTANAIYPDDYDPSNNSASGTVTVIEGTPILPPTGGFGANANANDFAFYGAFTTNPLTFLDYRGDSAQRAGIDSLSSTLLVDNGSGLTGTFTLQLHLFTVDSVGPVPATSTRNLTNATWTGDFAVLSHTALTSANPCVSSSQMGTLSVPFAANGNVPTLTICVVPAAASNTYRINVSVSWARSPSAPVVLSAANGAVSYGDYLYFHTDLSFSSFSENPVSHAPVALASDPALISGDPHPTFGAMARVRRYK